MGTEGLGPQPGQTFNFNLSKEAAEASYAKELKEGYAADIGRGDVKSRAMDIGGVYVASVGNHFGWVGDAVTAFINWKEDRPVFVKTKTPDGKNLYINTNSLSKRLGIPKNEIINATMGKTTHTKEKSEAILNLINQYATIHREREQQITEKFHEIQKEYQAHNRTPDESLLRKAIGITLISGFETGHQQQAAYRLSDHSLLHLSKQAEENFPLMTHMTQEYIGGGSFGKVEGAKILSTGENAAIKTGLDKEEIQQQKLDHDFNIVFGYTKEPENYKMGAYDENELAKKVSKASKEAENEIHIVKKIFDFCEEKGMEIKGIQQKFIQKIDFTIEGKTYKGHAGKRYKADLAKNINNSKKPLTSPEIIKCGYELISGISIQSQAGIVNGDIKPENCLVDESPDGSKSFVISDYGGAFDVNETPELPHTTTPGFFNPADREAFKSLAKKITEQEIKCSVLQKQYEEESLTSDKKDSIQTTLESEKKELERIQQQRRELLLKFDVYAIGRSLMVAFDQSDTTQISVEQYARLEALLLKMYSPPKKDPPSDGANWETRISAEDALTEYKSIFNIK